MGSPIVKSVFQHLAPRPHLRNQEKSSEWSILCQETTKDASTSTDYSEYDEKLIDKTRPEQLRDADYHRPDDNYAIAALAQDNKRLVSTARSPSVASLGQLLQPRTGRFKLLAPDSDSTTSSSEYDNSNVLTSTMRVGDTKESRPVLGIEDISVIKTRISLDPRMSVEPRIDVDRTGSSAAMLGQRQILSSTPARVTGLVEESLGVSSIHSSDAGGSMLVPRVEKEILTVERVEETDESEVEETDESEGKELQQFSNPRLSSPSSAIPSHTHTLVPGSSVPPSSAQTLSCLIRAELSSLSPPSRDSTGTRGISSLATKGSTIHPAKDSLHAVSGISIIQSDSFLDKPGGSSKLPKRSTSSVSSTDTSGEIFSAVVHSKMVTRLLPYVRTPSKVPWARTPAKATRDMKSKKRFVLASRRKVSSPPLSHFSPEEYYRGARASERSFDQIIEEENHSDGGVFSQE